MTDALALKVSGLDVHYKDFQALWGVSIEIEKGEIVSVIGANGAGKSTLLKTVTGLLAPTRGTIELFGERIDGMRPHETVPRGLALVPEGRRVFSRMTVYENLVMGSYPPKTRAGRDESMARIHDLFPVLKDRHHQMASTLSGGEQQMLAIGRAMMSRPEILICDELSLGLAPVIIRDIYKRLVQVNRDGTTIVLVEQDVQRSLKAADRVYVMLEGKVVLQGDAASLSVDEVKKAYFGI